MSGTPMVLLYHERQVLGRIGWSRPTRPAQSIPSRIMHRNSHLKPSVAAEELLADSGHSSWLSCFEPAPVPVPPCTGNELSVSPYLRLIARCRDPGLLQSHGQLCTHARPAGRTRAFSAPVSQVAALCGQHCLNNLLQGPYFSEVSLAEIAQVALPMGPRLSVGTRAHGGTRALLLPTPFAAPFPAEHASATHHQDG